jgi:hypothetical protein
MFLASLAQESEAQPVASSWVPNDWPVYLEARTGLDHGAINAGRGGGEVEHDEGDIMRTVGGLLACTVVLVSAAGAAGAVALRPAGQYAPT